jgi:hypothetical protein
MRRSDAGCKDTIHGKIVYAVDAFDVALRANRRSVRAWRRGDFDGRL